MWAFLGSGLQLLGMIRDGSWGDAPSRYGMRRWRAGYRFSRFFRRFLGQSRGAERLFTTKDHGQLARDDYALSMACW